MPSTGFNASPKRFNPGTGSFTAAPVRGGLGQGGVDGRLASLRNEGTAPIPAVAKGPATGMKTVKALGKPTRRTKRILTPFDSPYGQQRPFVAKPVIEGANY